MPAVVFDIKELGAVGDGTTDCTRYLRDASNKCQKAGGGTILVPAGRFVTGPFELFSNIDLHLDPGSELLAITDIEAYFPDENSMESPRIGLIYARNSENISISGQGSIDFQGTAFMDMATLTPWVDFDREGTRQGAGYLTELSGIGDGPVKVLERPGNLVQFLNCQNVSLSQVTLRNAPNWTVQFGDSRDIFVQGIRILNNLLIANSDGIHCTSCSNVHISNCHIESGDDSIAITTLTSEKDCENVTVSNCTLVSRSVGVRVGYGNGDIRNCLFQNLTIDSNRGVGVFARNGRTISEISFDHIIVRTKLLAGQWWGHGEPIHISAVRADKNIPAGVIRNVSFSNITAFSESGILIYGSEKDCLEQIRFKDIYLKILNSPLWESFGGNFDLRPAFASEERLFKHDEGGLFALNALYLSIIDFTLIWDKQPADIFTYGIKVKNCNEFTVKRFKSPDTGIPKQLGEIQVESK